MKHVILGSGAAGIKAAATLRKHCPTDQIIMVSHDEPAYSRCMLHFYLSHERDAAGLSFVNPDFFVNNEISRIQDTISGIDTAAKIVMLRDYGSLTYERLLIATGANSVIPPIGALKTAANVFGLRHLSDAQKIDDMAQSAQNVVIIGSGLIGLDAAYALLHLGKNVTVVEMVDRILPLNLDAEAAGVYQQKFAEEGCVFKLASKVCDTACDSNGNVSQILLEGGEALPCDLVIVAAGVRPAVEFLADSGIEYDRALKVDDHLRTSSPDIYAAGDVTGLSGIWPNAAKQGEIAALNMCGIDTVYDDTFAAKNTINFFGLPTLSVGAIEPQDGDRVLTRACRNFYQKIILRDNYVAGVILQGNIANSGIWLHIIKNKIKLWGPEDALWNVSYADFYQTDPSARYVWSA